MACIKAETGTLVFAIINIILVAISSVCSVGALCCWVYGVLMSPDLIHITPAKDLVIIFAWMLLSFSATVFSSFLLNGCLKENPAHIKVYYYYGVAFSVAALFAIIGFSLFSVPVNNVVLMCVAFAYVAYALVLRMVRHTFQNLEAQEVSTDLPTTSEAAEKSRPPRLSPEDYWNYLR